MLGPAVLNSNWKSTGFCPSCKMPFDRRKRRLLDSCGHERCLSCINKSDLCPLCVLTGSSPPKMSKMFPLTTRPESQALIGCGHELLAEASNLHLKADFKHSIGSPKLGLHSSESEKSRSCTPAVNLSFDLSQESERSSPINHSQEECLLQSARSESFGHGRIRGPQWEDDTANTSKESGFYSSGSDAPSGILIPRRNYRASHVSSTTRNMGSGATVRFTNEQQPNRHSVSTLIIGETFPCKLISTESQVSLVQTPGSSRITKQSKLYTTLDDKQPVNVSDTILETSFLNESAFNTYSDSPKLSLRSLDKTVHKKSFKAKSDVDRHSFCKPFQKIYSLKSRIIDKRTNKAQDKPSDIHMGKISVDSRQAVPRKSQKILEIKNFCDTDVESDQSSDISFSSTLPRSKGAKFLHTFLKPLYFEVPASFPISEFTGRRWLYREISDHLGSSHPTNRGVLITGSPGSGKTATILALVERSCFGLKSPPVQQKGISRSRSAGSFSPLLSEDFLTSLAKSVVAYHFCQADNAITCRVPEFIHSVSAQISQSPQLAAYFNLIQTEKYLRNLLSVSHCSSNPSESLVTGVLEPLKSLKKVGKISGEPCIIVIDALCEAEQHRSGFGDTIANFLAKHLLKFPTWLKVVCTVRSHINETTRLLPFHKISLDDVESDNRINRDMKTFISNRILKSKLIRGNMNSKAAETEYLERFSDFLVARAQGCFLYTKLILDLLERGQLVLKSGSFKVIPRTLSEIFLLMFNLRFSTSLSYERVCDIFAICLASLQSLNLKEVFKIYSALSCTPEVSWREIRNRYNSIADLLVTRSDGSMMFFHPTLRDWLVKRREGERFLVDVRVGHAAISFSILRSNSQMRPEKILTLAHHLLKAKMNRNFDYCHTVSCKDAQSMLISLTTGEVSAALGCARNIYAPVNKVSMLLLMSGASPDFITEELDQAPLLAVYAALGQTDMVSLLLQFSADPNKTNSRGQSPLLFASREGHVEIVEYLLHSGAELNRVCSEGICPLVAAARNGYFQIVEILVMCTWDEGPDQILVKEDAEHQALVAAAQYGHIQVVEYLLDRPNTMLDRVDDLTGLTAISAAAASGNKILVEFLLKRGSRTSAPTSDGQTAIHLSARLGCWDVLDALVKNEPDLISIRNKDGRTPVTMAAIGGHLGVLDLLKERGGSFDDTDNEGMTPLHHAVLGGHLQAVRLLLDHGIDVNITDIQGRTALSVSVEQEETNIIEILLDFRANMEKCDIHGVRPLEKAISLNKPDTVACFLKQGAKLGSGTWLIADGKPEIQMILINKILDDGNKLFRKNELQDASHRYKYALRKIPREEVEWADTFSKLETHLLLNLSRCERRLGNFAEAENLAQQVLDFDPECIEGLIAKAKAYKASGKKAEAMNILKSALKIVPANRDISRALDKLQGEVDDRALLTQIPPNLGSMQSIPYIDETSTNCSSSVTT